LAILLLFLCLLCLRAIVTAEIISLQSRYEEGGSEKALGQRVKKRMKFIFQLRAQKSMTHARSTLYSRNEQSQGKMQKLTRGGLALTRPS
jgi:hypothetical protein